MIVFRSYALNSFFLWCLYGTVFFLFIFLSYILFLFSSLCLTFSWPPWKSMLKCLLRLFRYIFFFIVYYVELLLPNCLWTEIFSSNCHRYHYRYKENTQQQNFFAQFCLLFSLLSLITVSQAFYNIIVIALFLSFCSVMIYSRQCRQFLSFKHIKIKLKNTLGLSI